MNGTNQINFSDKDLKQFTKSIGNSATQKLKQHKIWNRLQNEKDVVHWSPSYDGQENSSSIPESRKSSYHYEKIIDREILVKKQEKNQNTQTITTSTQMNQVETSFLKQLELIAQFNKDAENIKKRDILQKREQIHQLKYNIDDIVERKRQKIEFDKSFVGVFSKLEEQKLKATQAFESTNDQKPSKESSSNGQIIKHHSQLIKFDPPASRIEVMPTTGNLNLSQFIDNLHYADNVQRQDLDRQFYTQSQIVQPSKDEECKQDKTPDLQNEQSNQHLMQTFSKENFNFFPSQEIIIKNAHEMFKQVGIKDATHSHQSSIMQ